MDRKTLLDQGFTEEQVTKILNEFHDTNASVEAMKAEKAKLEADLAEKAKEAEKLKEYEKKIAEIEQANLSKEEQIALKEKEAEKKLAEANVINNTAKAKSILASVGIDDEDIIKTIVNSDETATIENATKIANKFKFVKEETAKKTKEELANINVKPGGTNVPDGVVNWEKFQSMSAEEQRLFAAEHPEEFEKL